MKASAMLADGAPSQFPRSGCVNEPLIRLLVDDKALWMNAEYIRTML